jgi:hypothetical protein
MLGLAIIFPILEPPSPRDIEATSKNIATPLYG